MNEFEEKVMEQIKGKKFEEVIKMLENIVERLERGDVPLDEALKLYEMGQVLIKYCKEKLTKVESKIKELVPTDEGLKLREIEKKLFPEKK